jgi:pimeloyl-ACP methyl ester carboxylesterase
LKIEKAIPVGHSIGGMVAARIAVRFPERTEKIVLMGTGIAMDPMQYGPVVPGLGEYLLSKTAIYHPTFSPKHAEAMRKSYEIEDTRKALLVYLRRQYTIDGLKLLYGTFENFPVPALHIHGTNDTSISHQAGKRLSERTSGQFSLVEGSDHYVHIEQPALVADLVTSFAL